MYSRTERVAPEKFVPSFAVKYATPDEGARPLAETAKFDVLVVSGLDGYAERWATNGQNSYHSLKRLNPDMRILVYRIGPGEYNSADWGKLGDGWEWIKREHGIGTADRWTAKGVFHGHYLEPVTPWPHERLMELGNANWRRYWMAKVYEKYWGSGLHDGTDGVFCDVTGYRVGYSGRWRKEGDTSKEDHPETYFVNGRYRHDKWQRHMNRFYSEARARLEPQGLALSVNFHRSGLQPEKWRDLDAYPDAPVFAMMEAGFVSPHGKQKGYNTGDWHRRVEVLRSLKHVRVLACSRGVKGPVSEGLARMDVPDYRGTTGWDALWFSLTSFLLGFDDERGNAYLNFTAWSYRSYRWFDEFDPRCLHLGKAVAEYRPAGRVYLREFEDGWSVVNPSETDTARGVRVPTGRARVIGHANLKVPQTAPLVGRFDLAPLRGVVLLKEGRKLGNGG